VLNLFASIGLMVATLLYYKQIESITNEIDAEQIGVQDYSIMIQDLPLDSKRTPLGLICLGEEIIEFL
jgi:hypothetical protein